MQVAFIITNKSKFNYTHYNNQEIGRGKALVDLGNNVDIYVYDRAGKQVYEVYKNKENCLRIIPYKGLPIIGNQTIPLNLKKLLRKQNYALVHLHEYPWILPCLIAPFLKKIGAKTILVQGMYEDFKGSIKSIYSKCFDLFLLSILRRNLDGITFKTSMAQQYFKKKNINKIPSRVIPVGLDTSVLETKLLNCPLDFETEKKIACFQKTLLYVGSVEDRRNPLFIVDILVKLVSEDKDYGLIVVGKGPMLNKLVSYIDQNKLNNNVVIIPSLTQSQLPWIYNNSDIFLLPSKYEIFGMVLLEAFFFDMIVISSPTAGAKEIIPNYDKGYIRAIDLNLWLEVIEKHFEKEVDRKVFNCDARFNWSNIAKEYITFYQELKG